MTPGMMSGPAPLADGDRRRHHGGARRSRDVMTTVAKPRLSPLLGHGDHLWRNFLFLATFLLWFFGVSPFKDTNDPTLLEPKVEADPLNQALTVLLTGALAIFAITKREALVTRAWTLPLFLTFIGFVISALLSPYPDVAARRIVLASFTILQASVVLLLPHGRQHFARLLTVGSLVVIATCYFGVAFLPTLSMHQISDPSDLALAGDWRGVFGHKNGAGAGMVLLIFFGMFIYGAWSRFAGLLVIVLAGIFLYFTHAKSPLNLLPVVLALSYFAARLRSSASALALILGVVVLINLMTVGSVMFEPIRDLVGRLLSDPTYTSRDEIWRFTLDHIAERPWFGFGFEAFWGMPDLVNAWSHTETWAYRASDAHNGYLNLAVTIGLFGLLLSLLWIIAQPFADFRHARAMEADPALTTLFLRIWIFGLCLSGFESVFFRGGSETWLWMAISIIGLRLQTIAKNSG